MEWMGQGQISALASFNNQCALCTGFNMAYEHFVMFHGQWLLTPHWISTRLMYIMFNDLLALDMRQIHSTQPYVHYYVQ